MKRQPSYIAIARSLFDHPRFKSTKPLSRVEAWQWLLKAASWRPEGHRKKFGIMHTERGQLCATRRELAGAWKWHKSRVDRFLKWLVADGMITLGQSRTEPKIEPKTAPEKGYPRTLITICNYEKFQGVLKTENYRANQKTSQKSSQILPQLPGLLYEIASKPCEPVKTNTKNNRQMVERSVDRRRPAQGTRWHGKIWINYESDEWRCYAIDFQMATGLTKMPDRYLDGKGNWFAEFGERQERTA